jgi:hypothetical protein
MGKTFRNCIILLVVIATGISTLSAQDPNLDNHVGLWAGMADSNTGSSNQFIFYLGSNGRFEYQAKVGSFQVQLAGTYTRSGNDIAIMMSTPTSNLRKASFKILSISGSSMKGVFIDSLHPQTTYDCRLTKRN